MNLEINLLRVSNTYASDGTLIARKRLVVDSPTLDQCLDYLKQFINSNSSLLDTVDPDILPMFNSINNFDVGAFFSFRYILTTYGLDLTYFFLADNEINVEGIEEKYVEYVVVNRNILYEFIPFADKIPISVEKLGEMDTLYKTIFANDSYFKAPSFDKVNPVKPLVSVLENSIQLMGAYRVNVCLQLNSILRFFNKDLFCYT